MTTTLLLVALLALLATSPFSSPDAGGSGAFSGIMFAYAGGKLPYCAHLSDLTSYGVNGALMGGGGVTYYLDAQYFCAKTAPAQYHCKCSRATTCKPKPDPWGRNIGTCECCPPWMIVCFTLMGILFAISILAGAYAALFRNCWWCDGYLLPPVILMPRRGPGVACPPRQPLPENLFRGYMSSDFINVATNSGEEEEEEEEEGDDGRDAQTENGGAANAAGGDEGHNTHGNAFAPQDEDSEEARSEL